MRRMLLVSGAVLSLAALAACSTKGSGSGGSAGGANLSDVGGGAYDASKPAVHGAPAAPPAPAEARDAAGVPTVRNDGAPLALGESKIRTATLTVAIKGSRNVASKATAAGSIATAIGGEIDSDDRVSGKHATATLRLLVPPDQLQDVLGQLSRLGIEKTRTSSTTDVTTKVADVTSRVASAQQAIDRLRLLYAKAPKVRDVIAIESELSGREAELESLQAQQRALARKTSMATITLQLITARKHVDQRPAKDDNGFLGGLGRGWDAFRSAAGWVATALGATLPFLLLALVIAFGVRLLWPRVRRTVPAPVAPSAPGE